MAKDFFDDFEAKKTVSGQRVLIGAPTDSLLLMHCIHTTRHVGKPPVCPLLHEAAIGILHQLHCVTSYVEPL